jgi:phospholipase C
MLRRVERATARRRIGAAADAEGAGTDGLPQIRHIVIVMQENHSYDNYLGMLTGRGDGFTLGPDGQPIGTNPGLEGEKWPLQHSPTVTALKHVPTQSWHASHIQWDNGACDGFVRSIEETEPGRDPQVAMRYWTEADLPFYYGLARTFPLASRWFCSCLGPTFPNRRFLISGTANGLIDDLPFGMVDYPISGTIFDHLDAHGISWIDYHNVPPRTVRWRLLSRARGLRYLRLLLGAIAGIFESLVPWLETKMEITALLYPGGVLRVLNHTRPIGDFFAAARTGSLPSVTIVDPDYKYNSEENPQDIQNGEAYVAQVVSAVMDGPGWPHTLLIWLYDEHGGYYDHVPPPTAPAPDDLPGLSPYERYPILRIFRKTALGRRVTEQDTGPRTYTRLGFRVPAVIVSPYARPGYVTDVGYDHTAILRLIQRKWNLPPMTGRDAAAADLLDALDLEGPAAFLTPPRLPEPALRSGGR